MHRKRIKFYGKRRRPSKGFFNSILSFFKALWDSISRWFSKTFPKKRPGQPFYTSRRFYLLTGGAAAAVLAAVFVPLNIVPMQQTQAEAEAFNEQQSIERQRAEQDAAEAAMYTPEPIYLADGHNGEEVSELQSRLMELGYMDHDEPTTLYGPVTEQAVIRFQILSGLEETGAVDNETWDMLFADNAAASTIAQGMSGDDIIDYQSRLLNLGYLNAAATGYFGTDTAAAVNDFQEKNGLETTGVIDAATSEKLYSDDVVAKYLMYGMKNDAVASAQQRLIDLGYLGGEADGDYGDRTQAAVKLFQQKSGLVVDGYLGVDTETLLMSDSAQPNAFTIGDTGEAVTQLQDKLVALNYITASTGYYGSDTQQAIYNFQANNGLTTDGAAGKETLSMLYSDNAVAGSSPIIVGRRAIIDNFIDVARSRLGTKYVLGAKGPSRFDCSGLVYWCLNQVGVNQSYVTSTVWRTVGNYETIKDIDDVQAGDIICFTPHHVGIAVNSTTMIDASTANGKVVERSFRTNYFERNFVCARRVF